MRLRLQRRLPIRQTFSPRRVLGQVIDIRRRRWRWLAAPACGIVAVGTAFLTGALCGTDAAALPALAVICCTLIFGPGAGLIAAMVSGLAVARAFDPVAARCLAIFSALVFGTHLAAVRGLRPYVSKLLRGDLSVPVPIRGHLDGFANGEVYGWAFDPAHPRRPVVVEVLVDRRPVANVAAVYYRPDIAERLKSSGQHGFYFDPTPYLPLDRAASIEVRLPTGAMLVGSPLGVEPPSPPLAPEKPSILFMHIAKAAGTAFREAMERNYRVSEIAYCYPGVPGFPVADLRELPLGQRREFRLVVGHIQFGLHDSLPQRSEYITLVREPGARILSQYAYAVKYAPESVRDDDGRTLSLPELLKRRLTTDYDNRLVRCFAGVDESEFPPGRLTADHYERAVLHLRCCFAFVGHQENLAAAYAALASRYGWQPASELAESNVGGRFTAPDPQSDVGAAIRQFNTWDYRLYDEILRLYPISVTP